MRKKSNHVIEHGNRIWDTLSIKTDRNLLLTGVGVYSPTSGGNSQVVINVDARPLKEPLRPLDLATPLDSMTDDSDTLTIFSKVR